jgi:hypothetical protein
VGPGGAGGGLSIVRSPLASSGKTIPELLDTVPLGSRVISWVGT